MFAFLSIGWYVGVCGFVAVVAITAMIWRGIVRVIPDEVDQEEMRRCKEDCQKLREACCKAEQAERPRSPSPEYLQAISKQSVN